jgi:LmbE family N-acetylglucosaminyl deacetylase
LLFTTTKVSDGDDTTQFPAPTHYVDITNTADAKKAACYAHATQNPDYFYGVQDAVATFRGLQAGSKKAEAFTYCKSAARICWAKRV